MKKILLLFILLFNLFTSIFATTLDTGNPIPICGTPFLWGKYPEIIITKSLAKPVAGDTTFYIRDDIYASPPTLEEIAFYRKVKNDTIDIYVEVDEYDGGRVTDDDIESIKVSLLYRTPDGSINSNKGIYANEMDIFGEPPDVDKNGKLFVLLIDVRDGYESGTSDTYVAGYFDPLDQDKSKGNYSDIIYIDTYPAHVNDPFTLSVVAHEMQHLIHYGYDSNESIWLNEGLSELAPRLLGLPSRSFAPFLHDTNRPLNSFDNSITDYSKVGLWTFYIYKNYGIEIIKSVVQNPENSLGSYELVLNSAGYSYTKEELMRDWFIANLINNSSTYNGKCGYGDADIPSISSEHFSANFTNGEVIESQLSYAAAEYIQFYGGRDIDFELKYNLNDNLSLAIVKHCDTPIVSTIENCPSTYNYRDDQFGIDYDRISFIPYRTSVSSIIEKLNYSYYADGIGGYEEEEIAFDGDSISFYINIGEGEAAEKFIMPLPDSKLAAVKFNTYNENPVKIKIYNSITEMPVLEFNNIIPNVQSWTRVNIERDIIPEGSDYYLISISSRDTLSLGYSHTKEGKDRAYLKVTETGPFQDLSNFEIKGDLKLTGDWLIRAIVQSPSSTPAEIVLEPDSLYFWRNEIQSSFKIANKGTEALEWSISGNYADWLDFDIKEGIVVYSENIITVFVDRNILPAPRLYEQFVHITSNGGNDSLFISVLERNMQESQAAFIPEYCAIDSSIGKFWVKVFNIGVGESEFLFTSESPFLEFVPSSGNVGINDTVFTEVFIDREIISSNELPFTFYNGVYKEEKSFLYNGAISMSDSKLAVLPNVQNPFVAASQGYTTIQVRLANDSKPSLKIYNILGQGVKSFDFENYNTGLHLFQWDGTNYYGEMVSSGVYIIFLEQSGKVAKRKMLVIR
jgi:hypothetical protein